MTVRSERMIAAAPDYYETSRIFKQIQEAQAADYDGVDEKNEDLIRQLYIPTATWALRFYEEELNLSLIHI